MRRLGFLRDIATHLVLAGAILGIVRGLTPGRVVDGPGGSSRPVEEAHARSCSVCQSPYRAARRDGARAAAYPLKAQTRGVRQATRLVVR